MKRWIDLTFCTCVYAFVQHVGGENKKGKLREITFMYGKTYGYIIKTAEKLAMKL